MRLTGSISKLQTPSEVSDQASLDGCIAGGSGSGTFCSLIQRDTAGLWLSNDAPGGGLAGISQQNANITANNRRG